jgi:acyl dehydratase
MVERFEELVAGTDIPLLQREIGTEDLVRYAGASDDYSRQHWDHAYMVSRGFPGVIVHGWLTFAVMCQAVSRFIPPEVADISAFAVRYHRPHGPGPMTCGGRLTRTSAARGRSQAEFEVWTRDSKGDITATASLTMTFI